MMNRTMIMFGAGLTFLGSVLAAQEQRVGESLAGPVADQVNAGNNAVPYPKGKEAQSLFNVWTRGARKNGTIPGGTLAPLSRTVENFIKRNPTHVASPKLAELVKRIDISHDWTPTEAIGLLDDVTVLYASLPSWVEGEKRFSLQGSIHTGQPLTRQLDDAPWGEPQSDGLRVAWLLDPRALQYRLGTALKSRIIFHNKGKNTVVFRALTWNQSGAHKAVDDGGDEYTIQSLEWTTIPQVIPCRLAPGEFIEVLGAGIGIGAKGDDEDWQGTRVGSWIEASEWNKVTFAPHPVSIDGNLANRVPEEGEADWWLVFIKDRLSLDLPLPDSADERIHLLERAVHDIFGTKPTTEEISTFVADRTPDAMDALVQRLFLRSGFVAVSGTLKSGRMKFRVLPVDPDVAKKPRMATNPGRYTLTESIRLIVSRRLEGERLINEAFIQFSTTDPQKSPPDEPCKLELPDGYGTWAAAWERGVSVLWVIQNDHLHRYDFTNPARVTKSDLEGALSLDMVPATILETLRKALAGADGPKPAASPSNSNDE